MENHKEQLRKALEKKGHIVVDRIMVHLLGLNTAVLFCDMVQLETYLDSKGITQDGWFHYSQDAMELDTSLTPHKQTYCIDTLVNERLIWTERKGMPARMYFKINHRRALFILSKKEAPSSRFFNNYIIYSLVSINNTYVLSISPKEHITAFSEKHKENTKKPKNKNVQILEYWNSLPNVRKHKTESSKVYKHALVMIRKLKEGKLAKVTLDREWCNKHKITKKILSREWKDEQIMLVFTELAKMFDSAYWPYDKKWIPRSLADLIYSSYTTRSWFMFAAVNGVPTIEIAQVKQQGKTDPIAYQAQEMLKRTLYQLRDTHKLATGEYRQLSYAVRDMRNELDQLKRTGTLPVDYDLATLVDEYSAWVQDRYHDKKEVTTAQLSTGGYIWQEFVLKVLS